jgi:hypothetical protein
MINQIIHLGYKNKLKQYSGFSKENLYLWMQQKELSIIDKIKIVRNIEIITSQDIRGYLRTFVEHNEDYLDQFDCILSFGQAGKSGDILLYEFRHSRITSDKKYIRLDELIKLGKKSKILFVDDLIGTGRQSVKYINNTLNTVIPQDVEYSLFTLFSTISGVQNITNKTNVASVRSLFTITEEESILSDQNKIFSCKEKERIKKANELLGSGTSDFDYYFLFGFYYSMPNNSLQLLWKNNFKYENRGTNKVWHALLPREY